MAVFLYVAMTDREFIPWAIVIKINYMISGITKHMKIYAITR